MKRIILFFLPCYFVFPSCAEYTPKPLGYPRIERSVGTIQKYENSKFSFSYSQAAQIIPQMSAQKEEIWFNISYPEYNAILYCTYIPVNKATFRKALDDSYRLAYSHASKADGILQEQFENEERKTSGLIYDIKGSVAVPIQFFVTDSIANFLRGSLYYNEVMNVDSVAPVTQFLRDDIKLIIESLEWKNHK